MGIFSVPQFRKLQHDWTLRSDVDHVLGSITDTAPAAKRPEVSYWCDCKEANEKFTGERVKHARAWGLEHERNYNTVPTICEDGEHCYFCGYAAQAKRLTEEEYQAALPRAGVSNRNRARKLLQVDPATGKVVREFVSSEEAIANGIRSVRWAVKTGTVYKGFLYKYADGGIAMKYRGARTGKRKGKSAIKQTINRGKKV